MRVDDDLFTTAVAWCVAMTELEKLKRSILLECEDDHVGLWSVIRDAADVLAEQDEPSLRRQVIQALHEMLSAKQIKAGFPAHTGRGFRGTSVARKSRRAN